MKDFSHLCSQHILASEQYGFLYYTSSKCIIRADQWMKQEEKIACNDIIWGCPAYCPCLGHSPLRHTSHMAQGALKSVMAGNTQSDKLLKPVLISDAAKCQLYSHPISLTGHSAFLSSHFHVCLTHTVSSLLKLLSLVFLPQPAHSQWFPISSFRFVSWSLLLVLVAFPRHFPPFPPYLITT